jgi:hypothetical protein
MLKLLVLIVKQLFPLLKDVLKIGNLIVEVVLQKKFRKKEIKL